MRQRKYISIILLLLTFFVADSLYAQQAEDTSATRSLNDEAVDTSIADSVAGGDTIVENNTDQVRADEKSEEKEMIFFSPVTNDTLNEIRSFSPDAWSKIKSDDDFKYGLREERKQAENENNADFLEKLVRALSSKTARVLIWSLVIAFLAFLFIVYLINNKILLATKGRKIKQEEGEATASENIFDIDFKTSINKAIADNDLRLATRLCFLQMLKQMSLKNIIQYGFDKTNMDYLFELNGTPYFKDFATASRNYEYVWYGKFAITKEQFDDLKSSFSKF
ncbi:hypothetical protein QTN47_07970 [Danxiaibacter flavus]|uniref:DUF4129 domain-containing protein n=1 Tax=Danxiaibacter flavus TaxID=3049108 RepID=A0ABV3ZED0_9BACT